MKYSYFKIEANTKGYDYFLTVKKIGIVISDVVYTNHGEWSWDELNLEKHWYDYYFNVEEIGIVISGVLDTNYGDWLWDELNLERHWWDIKGVVYALKEYLYLNKKSILSEPIGEYLYKKYLNTHCKLKGNKQ